MHHTMLPRVLFRIIMTAYWLLLSFSNVCHLILGYLYQRLYYKDNNKALAISMNKRPKVITFAFYITKTADMKVVGHRINQYVQLAKEIDFTQLSLYLMYEQGSMNSFSRQLQGQLKSQMEMESGKQRVEVISESEGVPYIGSVDKSRVPLVVVFTEYPSCCGLPYQYLVNAEIAFCPLVQHSNLNHLMASYQTYAASKQRNGA